MVCYRLQKQTVKDMSEKKKTAKEVLGWKYWPLYCAVYPLAWIHALHASNPLAMALIDVLLVALLIAKW